MQTKHTPGPWTHETISGALYDSHHLKSGDRTLAVFCNVRDVRANLRLCALAPELAEALNEFNSLLSNWRQFEIESMGLDGFRLRVLDLLARLDAEG